MNSKYIFATWPAPPQVKALTTTRNGGVSQAPFASFNLGLHTTDQPEAVLTNRRLLKTELELPNEPAWLHQIHGTVAVPAQQVDKQTQADASYTDSPNFVCVAMTADCLPVLLCNQEGTQVAAIHAGWRGLGHGIIENTLAQLRRSSPQSTTWMAWLGPAIGPKIFEVGEEVRQLFVDAQQESALAFIPHAPNKWLADIFSLARLRLQRQGVDQIYGGQLCTYNNPSQFYSYRRDQGKTGCMASLIWLTSS